ncbi:MAG: hypothetical protein K8T91_00845 [Planctomycetes bacterium]|nr:hypothetical protein [Planctomycetota bacterium]
MASEYNDDFLRWTYTFEVDHKDRLDSGDGMLITVVIVLGAAGAYYMQIWPGTAWGFWQWVFAVLSVLFFLAFGAAAVTVIGSIWPRKKGLPSHPHKYLEFLKGHEKYYRHYHSSEDKVDTRVEYELRRMLRGNLVDAAGNNRDKNLTKMKWQVASKVAISVVIAIIFLNVVPSFFCMQANKASEMDDIHKVEIMAMPPNNGTKP